MEKFLSIFLVFIIYSFIGWSLEVLNKLAEKKKFINRGFLIGPVCPIYGCGALIVLFFLRPYKRNMLLLFFMAMMICAFLEYVTSYIMEKLFKTRWWDYSNCKFNINGRICLDTMLQFGILSTVASYVINPFMEYLLSLVNIKILNIVSLVLLVLFVLDSIITIYIISKYRKDIKNIEKDSTEEIVKIREDFMKKGILYHRLIGAFPTMKSTKEMLIALRDRINNELSKYL